MYYRTACLSCAVVPLAVTTATTSSCTVGSATAFVTGGTGPYTYSLDGNTYQVSNVFLNLPAGIYSGYVKDSKTCVGTLNGILVGPNCPPPPIAANNKNAKYVTSVQVSAVLKVSVYPNPTNTIFMLLLDGYNSKEKLSITLTDILGRKVYQAEGTGKQQFKFGNDLNAGIYNLQVIQGNNLKSIKLVKE